jgi:undecaprenyl diphosphate synthase
VEYVTVYALSTENLKRPEGELEGLFNLIRNHFKEYIGRICANGIRLRIIGDTALLPDDVQQILRDCEKDTEKYDKKGINVALAYGSRAEIVRAVNLAVERGEKVDEESFSSLLYTHGQPELDLLIRTGKEQRLSNFLLYQAAYAELYFSDKMFPEFSDEDLEKAVEEFFSRTRRFGKTDEQCSAEKE